MELYNTTNPVNVDVFLRAKFPKISDEHVQFLIEWRDCMFNKIPFLGWNSVAGKKDYTELMAAAHSYADYLEQWADMHENIYGSIGNHVSDVNIYEN